MPYVEPRRFKSLMVSAIALPVLLLMALALLLFWEVTSLLEASRAADLSDAILTDVVRTRQLLIDRETGLRGFLLTGDERFLEPYGRAGEQLPGALQRLASRLEDAPEQLAHVEALREWRRDWEGVAHRELELYRQGGDYLALVRAGEGKRRMDAIREQLDAIDSLERQRATLREAEAERQAWFVLWSSAVCVVSVAGLLAWVSRRQLLLLAREYENSLAQVEAQAATLRASEARLEAAVAQRTEELTLANRELESFSYSVSHDLRAPLRAVDGFSQALLEDEGERMTGQGHELLKRLRAAATRMGQLIDDLLQLSRVSRTELRRERVDLSALAREVLDELRRQEPTRDVAVEISPELEARGDARLLRVALENLLGNAWKFTSKRSGARIEFFAEGHEGRTRYVVRDNGVGFDMEYADKLFSPFQRMHKVTEFPGTGIGLATVQRIVHRHRGHIEAQAAPGAGATFRFTLEEIPP